MTLQQFETALKRYIPHVHIRQAGYGDIAAIYVGSDYLVRLNKGDLPLYSFRKHYLDKVHGQYKTNRKRGRMQALNMLVNMRWLNARQAQELMWGTYA